MTKMPEGFIDGDLIERFLDLPQAQMEDVCRGIKVCTSAEVVTILVDALFSLACAWRKSSLVCLP